jgi:hypothetical protein
MRNYTHTQYTNVFTWKPKERENHIIIFLICLEELHSLEVPTLFFVLATTGRRLQPPSFSECNLRESPTPQFYGYNQKEATTPYVLRLQPECGYNHLSSPCPTALK